MTFNLKTWTSPVGFSSLNNHIHTARATGNNNQGTTIKKPNRPKQKKEARFYKLLSASPDWGLPGTTANRQRGHVWEQLPAVEGLGSCRVVHSSLELLRYNWASLSASPLALAKALPGTHLHFTGLKYNSFPRRELIWLKPFSSKQQIQPRLHVVQI